MSAQNTPQLVENAANAGLTLSRSEADMSRSIDEKVLGFACVELIGKLENEFAKARQLQPSEYIDEAAETARKMLGLLVSFADEHLSDEASQQAHQELGKATTVTHTYDEILKTRPLGNALLRAFWKAEEVDSIKQGHKTLGDSLIRATAATLYHAIMALGSDTEMGREIDQSTVVFVNELNQSW